MQTGRAPVAPLLLSRHGPFWNERCVISPVVSVVSVVSFFGDRFGNQAKGWGRWPYWGGGGNSKSKEIKPQDALLRSSVWIQNNPFASDDGG